MGGFEGRLPEKVKKKDYSTTLTFLTGLKKKEPRCWFFCRLKGRKRRKIKKNRAISAGEGGGARCRAGGSSMQAHEIEKHGRKKGN